MERYMEGGFAQIWNAFTSRDEATGFLKEMIESHPWYRAICIRDLPIGSIYVMPGVGKDHRRGEIGYALNAKYWGKGIATEAVKMAVSCAFKELKCLSRVEGLVFAENRASQRVLEKAGFVKEVIQVASNLPRINYEPGFGEYLKSINLTSLS
ncbi:hypothetical protein SLEP1_g19150 [Rubroshorea leprosula]|nr:hypothetical protein SLEP1_g19150 [Rubroshorea leprosula]